MVENGNCRQAIEAILYTNTQQNDYGIRDFYMPVFFIYIFFIEENGHKENIEKYINLDL